MTFKVVTPSFAGDSQHFGGDDLNKISNLLGGTDIIATETPDINTATRFRDQKFRIRNPANTFSYIFSSSAITSADRTLTLPLLTGNDTMAVLALAQTMVNKTLNVDENTIKDSTTNTAGDVLASNGTKFIRKARGSANQVLAVDSGATDTVFTTLAKANLPSAIAYEDEANTFTTNQKMETFFEQKTITIPSDPASTYIKVYPKAVDANNDGWFAKTKINAAIVEVRIF